METKLIRVTKPDYDRISFMKGYLSITKFITSLLDKEEQPKEEPKPKRANPQLKKKPVHPSFARCKDLFFENWQKRNKSEFKSWSAAHAVALNGIIKKLESEYPDNDTADLFAVMIDRLPAFYYNQFLTAINKNYDSIISEIKNGKQQDSKGWNNIRPEHDWRL